MAAAIHVTDSFLLQPVLPVWVSAAVAALLVAAALLTARRWPLPVARPRRLVLMALRAAVVLAVILLLVRPVVVWQGRQEVLGRVAVLVDATRSMQIRDAVTAQGLPVTRGGAVRGAFQASGGAYADLAARCEVRPFAFGSHLRPADTFVPEFEDRRTDLGGALSALADQAGRRLAAVVLISDGRGNRAGAVAADAAAARLVERGVRVHTVAVGSPRPTDRVRDVAVADLRAPARVFAGNRAAVRAVVAALGMKDRPVDLLLKVNGEVAERRRLEPTSHRMTREVVFTPTLEEPGLARIALEVEPVEGELVEANNRAETLLFVEEGGIRVLYLEGRIRPEGKFVGRALGGAAEIELDRRILVGPQAPAASPTPRDLDRYDVFVLGDVPAALLSAQVVARLAERVRSDGAGLLALGGRGAFGAGGWAGTPVADVLPFAIRDGDGRVEGPVRFRPTPAGRRHFILNLADGGETADLFASLPPLSGASAVGPLHPTARCLAESPEGAPLLAVREFGRGRAAALTVDTTWLWVLAGEDPRGPERHRSFWRQLVLWLAGRDGPPRDDLWVMTDRLRYLMPDRDRPPAVRVTVHVSRGAGAAPSLRVTAPDGAEASVALEPVGRDRWRAGLRPRVPGTYALAAEADLEGERRRAESRFVVEEQDFEMADVLADHENLESIAEAGGGTFRTVDGLGRLLSELAEDLAPMSEPRERRLPLGSGRLFLAIVVGLLAAGWFLRRHWGLA